MSPYSTTVWRVRTSNHRAMFSGGPGRGRYVGDTGQSIGMRSFGATAPLKQLQHKFGFTLDNVAEAAREQIRQARR